MNDYQISYEIYSKGDSDYTLTYSSSPGSVFFIFSFISINSSLSSIFNFSFHIDIERGMGAMEIHVCIIKVSNFFKTTDLLISSSSLMTQ